MKETNCCEIFLKQRNSLPEVPHERLTIPGCIFNYDVSSVFITVLPNGPRHFRTEHGMAVLVSSPRAGLKTFDDAAEAAGS